MATVNALKEDVLEDGEEMPPPDLLNEYWLGLYHNDQYMGLYRLHKITSVCWLAHGLMLKDNRGFAIIAGKTIMGWIIGNIQKFERLVVDVPECFTKVIKFVKYLGLKEEGFSEKSYMKNGLIGMYRFGISKEEMIKRAILWQ